MTVKTLYIVTRGEEEVMRTEDKKHADWYDKRMDCGLNLMNFLELDKDLIKGLNETQLESICVYLAMHSGKVGGILKGKDCSSVVGSYGMDEYNKK